MTVNVPDETVPETNASGSPWRMVWLLWVSSALLACVVAFVPVTYDTLHVTDTTFIAQMAQYVSDGAVPGRDFNHFYGGAHEQVIAWSYAIFGETIKALDLALVLQSLAGTAILLVLAWGRLDATKTALIATIMASVLFARQPLEEHAMVRQLTAAHSFGYNRLGTVLIMLATIPLLIPTSRRSAQMMGAAIAGLCGALAIITKTTFFPAPIALGLSLALLGRYRELAIFISATGLTAVILDPSGARIFGTFFYSVDAAAGGGGLSTLARKAILLIGSQQIFLLIFAGILSVVMLRGTHTFYKTAGAATLILLGFWAATVPMGPAGLTGQQSLPILSTIGVLLWSTARRHDAGLAKRIGPLAVVLSAALIVPHGLNTLGSAAKAIWNTQHVAFPEGRMKGYLAQGRRPYLESETGRELLYSADRHQVITQTRRRLESGELDAGIQYIRLAEAIRLLEDLPNVNTLKVVNDSQLGLGFALDLPRVEGFPEWMRPNSPEFTADFLRDVDLVLLDATGQSHFDDILRLQMQDFRLCRKTVLWELYARSNLHRALDQICQGPASGGAE